MTREPSFKAIRAVSTEIRLVDRPYDQFECGLLPVLRHLLTSMQKPETQSWHTAFSISVERWGEGIGLSIAHNLASLAHVYARSRKGKYDINDPLNLDQRLNLTDDERNLMDMIHYMRRDDTKAARLAVKQAALGRMDPDLIRAGLSFAARFSFGAPEKSQAQIRPTLRVVS